MERIPTVASLQKTRSEWLSTLRFGTAVDGRYAGLGADVYTDLEREEEAEEGGLVKAKLLNQPGLPKEVVPCTTTGKGIIVGRMAAGVQGKASVFGRMAAGVQGSHQSLARAAQTWWCSGCHRALQ